MYIFPLVLTFKGNRNYVQSADLYNVIAIHLGNRFGKNQVNNFQMNLHRFVNKQCNLILQDSDKTKVKGHEYFGEIRFTHAGHNVKGWLEETNNPIALRESFDEEIINSLAILSEKEIKIDKKLKYSPIEIIVSLTKQLHKQAYPDLKGKWIFTKIELDRLLRKEDTKISIEIKHNFHNKLTKSRIFINGSTIGNIYFSYLNGGNQS